VNRSSRRLFAAPTLLLVLLVIVTSFSISSCSRNPADEANQASASKAGGQAATTEQVASGDPITGCKVGEKAPDFSLTTLQGEQVQLSGLRGDVVIVDFWATWCAPCRMAIPHLQDLQDEFGDRGLTIVGVAMDQQGERVVRPFAEKNHLRFKVAMPNGRIAQDYCGISALPTTFIIDPDGVIQRKYIGYRDKKIYLNDIQTLKPELAI
jgi:peroxiredoxin